MKSFYCPECEYTFETVVFTDSPYGDISNCPKCAQVCYAHDVSEYYLNLVDEEEYI